MAKQIIWPLKAINDLLDILEYWYNRNKSTDYPRKLFKLINQAIEKLAEEHLLAIKHVDLTGRDHGAFRLSPHTPCTTNL